LIAILIPISFFIGMNCFCFSSLSLRRRGTEGEVSNVGANFIFAHKGRTWFGCAHRRQGSPLRFSSLSLRRRGTEGEVFTVGANFMPALSLSNGFARSPLHPVERGQRGEA
jgi:hypothetical protein